MIKRYILLLLSVVLLLSPGIVSAQFLTQITWSNEIQKGDSYSWTISEFKINDSFVEEPLVADYGIIHGTVITINILEDISDLLLHEVRLQFVDIYQYFEIIIDGVKYQGDLFVMTIRLFIIPVTYKLYVDSEPMNILEENRFTVDGVYGETNAFGKYKVEYDDGEEILEAEWDASSGLLNDYYNQEVYLNGATREIVVVRNMSFFERYHMEFLLFLGFLILGIASILFYVRFIHQKMRSFIHNNQ